MTSKLIFLTNPIHPQVHAEMETFARVSVAASIRDEDLIAGAREASIVVVRTPIPVALYDQAPLLLGVIRHGAGWRLAGTNAPDGVYWRADIFCVCNALVVTKVVAWHSINIG
jgi:D-3-phosphoglycerate dehydrogenase